MFINDLTLDKNNKKVYFNMNNTEEISFLIGKKLKELRLKAGFKSYEQFAYEKKISRIQYWKMEMAAILRLKVY